MDVVVANLFQEELMNLDTDIIKCVKGEFNVGEIVEMFQNFFYDRLIIDVTALKSYNDYNIFEKLAKGLDPDRIIFLLPEGSTLCTPGFLQKLISYGVYNFTTNVKGVAYLLKKPNTYQDVEKIAKMATPKKIVRTPSTSVENTSSVPSGGTSTPSVSSAPRAAAPAAKANAAKVKRKPVIIGVYNVTASAGASTLIFMMLKELIHAYGAENVLAIEIDKTDFHYFYHKRMISVKQLDLQKVLAQYANVKIILVDLNTYKQTSFCNEILYLIEPSTFKLNRLMERNKTIFSNLASKKVLLNQSILQPNDVFNFENEAEIKIFYNIPPLDERKRNSIISDFLSKLGLIGSADNSSSGKIFGLFRR